MRAAVGIFLVGSFVACSSDYGTEATPPTGDGGATTPTTTACGTIPNGWHGPLIFMEGTGDLPGCPSGFDVAFDGRADREDGTAGCECSCAPSGSFTCIDPVFSLYADATCATPCGGPPVMVSKSCSDLVRTGCPSPPWFKVVDAKPGATCAPSNTPPPSYTWKKSARLCRPTSAPSSECPAAPAPFDASLVCIATVGKVTCPTDFGDARSYLDASAIVDSRKCKTCSCGPGVASCGGSIEFTDKSCGEGFQLKETQAVPQTCKRLTETLLDSMKYVSVDGSGAICAPSGGGVEGEVGGTSLTVCCHRR